jgi:hypothetical protein
MRRLEKCILTRRQCLIRAGGLWGLATFSSCAPKFAQSRVAEIDAATLSIINLLDQNLVAHDIRGARSGKLRLSECCLWHPAVALDATSIAWLSIQSAPLAQGEDQQTILLRVDTHPAREIRYLGRGLHLAVSSGANWIALIAATRRRGLRLVLIDSQSGELAFDLTDRIGSFALQETERLQISSRGDRMVVATRDAFVVLEPGSKELIAMSGSRFPSISPTADTLAFVDGRTLVSMEISSGKRRTLGIAGKVFWRWCLGSVRRVPAHRAQGRFSSSVRADSG